MKKILSLFQRNYGGDRLVRNEVVPGAEWVLAGEGMATRKFDGTCCLFQDGRWFKRYDAKAGKAPPADFMPAQDAADPVTGHWPGWLPVNGNDKWHTEAILRDNSYTPCEDGVWRHFVKFKSGSTYELIGPKVQSNPENAPFHMMVRHGHLLIHQLDLPEYRNFETIKKYLATHHIEGVVWHHSDGRMVKIKAKDFGLTR